MTINIKKKIVHSSPTNEAIMIKLSEIAGAVGALHTKADAITAKLDAFLPGVTDPPIPADAEAGLTTLSDKLSSIDAKIPAVPPTVV